MSDKCEKCLGVGSVYFVLVDANGENPVRGSWPCPRCNRDVPDDLEFEEEFNEIRDAMDERGEA